MPFPKRIIQKVNIKELLYFELANQLLRVYSPLKLGKSLIIQTNNVIPSRRPEIELVNKILICQLVYYAV